MKYEGLEIPPPEESEFLEIVGIYAPTSVTKGELVRISLSLINTGAVAGDFMWEAKDKYNNLLGSDSGGLLNGLPVNSHVYGEFSFTMPNYDVNVTLKTYHKYGTTWLSDDTEYFTIFLSTEPPEVLEGDYTGISWNTGISLGGITTDGNYLWVTDHYNAKVYKYNMNGTYTGISWGTAGSGCLKPTDITTDGIYFWITDVYKAEVYKYNLNGTYTGEHWDTGINNGPTGITTNGEYFWITNESNDEVYKYNMNGIYTGEHWDTYVNKCHYPFGITTDGNYLWIVSHWTARVYKYTLNGTYVGSWPTNSLNAYPFGITTDGIYFWITDEDKKVYKYAGPLTTVEGFLKITGVTAPSEANEGDAVQIIIHTKNTGASDNFKIGLSGDLTASQEFSLKVGLKKDFPFPFTMPNHDASITAKTFHLE